MKLTLTSTSQIVEMNGVHCRVWQGSTESGVEVFAFIARVAIDDKADGEQFERELIEQPAPTAVWPSRMLV